jgi:hypothetical protein
VIDERVDSSAPAVAATADSQPERFSFF